MNIKNCILCQSPIQVSETALKSHYESCSMQYKVQCRFLLTRVVLNNISICYDCGQSFKEEQWKVHSKRRHRVEKTSSLVHYDAQNLTQRPITITTGYSLAPSHTLSKSLATIAFQYTFANVPLFINLNGHVSTKNLSNFFIQKLATHVGQILTSKVPIITEKQIKSLHIRLLKDVKPEQLANSIFVDNLLLRLTPNNQVKLITFLNKKAKATGSFEVRPIPKIHRQRKQFKPAKLNQVIKLLSSLIRSGKIQLTHIGIDMLIIFQSAVRFLSDYQLLERQILQNKPTIYLKIKKTNNQAKIVLPLQTLQLIRTTKWTGWHPKTIKLYKQMRSWSGMRGYTLKYTLLTYLYLIKPQQISTNQTGHKFFENMLPYLNVIQNELNRQGLKYTEIPNVLNSQNTWEIVQKITNQLFIGLDEAYERLDEKYMENLVHLVYRDRQQFLKDNTNVITEQPIQISFLDISERKEKAPLLNLLLSQAEQSIQNENSSALSHTSQYLIYGNDIVGSFEEYLHQIVDGKQVCVFCTQIYHPPLCRCLNAKPCIPLLSTKGQKKLNISIKIPSEYFNRTFDPEYLKMRRLIALRRLKYAQEATCTFGSFGTDDSVKMSWNSQSYRRLKNQQYFPPVKLIRSGGRFLTFEDSFGLAAKEEIEQYTLIGEYSADIISSEYLQCNRRSDTVMELCAINGLKLSISPVISMGYICLLNCAISESQQNCNSLKLQINGETKIIIYTIRKIKIDQELLYHYGENFKINLLPISTPTKKTKVGKDLSDEKMNSNLEFKLSTKSTSFSKRKPSPKSACVVQEEKFKKSQIIQLEDNNEMIFFHNTGIDCYKNVILVAFKQVLHQFPVFKVCYEQRSTKSLDESLSLAKNQQDCSQFLALVLLDKNVYDVYSSIYRNQICLEKMCQKCKFFSETVDNFDFFATESSCFSSLQQDVEKRECPFDYVCQRCKQIGCTFMRREIIIKAPKIVLMRKKTDVCRYEQFIKISNRVLRLQGAITYSGDKNSGHYMYFNGTQFISDDLVLSRSSVVYRPYLAIYKVTS